MFDLREEQERVILVGVQENGGANAEESLDELAEKKKELNRVAHEMGTEIAIPFMFLSFICLAAIPAYAITDCGFIDVVKQQVVDPILEVVE